MTINVEFAKLLYKDGLEPADLISLGRMAREKAKDPKTAEIFTRNKGKKLVLTVACDEAHNEAVARELTALLGAHSLNPRQNAFSILSAETGRKVSAWTT